MTALSRLTDDQLINTLGNSDIPEERERAIKDELRRRLAPPPAGVLHPREAERVLYGKALDAIRRAHTGMEGCTDECASTRNPDDDCDCGYIEAAHDVADYAHRTLIAGDKLGTAATLTLCGETVPDRFGGTLSCEERIGHGRVSANGYHRHGAVVFDGGLTEPPAPLSAEFVAAADALRRDLAHRWVNGAFPEPGTKAKIDAYDAARAARAPVTPTPDPINTAYEECALLCDRLRARYVDVGNQEAILAVGWCAHGIRKLAEAARAPVTPTPEPLSCALCSGPLHDGACLGAGSSSTVRAPEPLSRAEQLARDETDAADGDRTPEPCGFRDEARAFGPCVLWGAKHVGNHKDAQGRRWQGWVEPEPATVECDHSGQQRDVNRETGELGPWVCAWCKKVLEPASPPARPPAVTRRTIRELVWDHVTAKQWDDRMLRVEALAAVVDGLIQELDEDEARRDADRRGTK